MWRMLVLDGPLPVAVVGVGIAVIGVEVTGVFVFPSPDRRAFRAASQSKTDLVLRDE